MPQAFSDLLCGFFFATAVVHGSLNTRAVLATAWQAFQGVAHLQVAMARLFIRGKDYGPHAFVVPIRDMATHLPLPGIRVGDIGPKFGYNGVDNGFLSFNHVRVPYENMLARFAKARALCSLAPAHPTT